MSNTLIQQLKTMAESIHFAYELVNNHPNKLLITKFMSIVLCPLRQTTLAFHMNVIENVATAPVRREQLCGNVTWFNEFELRRLCHERGVGRERYPLFLVETCARRPRSEFVRTV